MDEVCDYKGSSAKPAPERKPVDEAHRIEDLGARSLQGDKSAASTLAAEVHTILSSSNLAYQEAVNAALKADHKGMQFQQGDRFAGHDLYLEVDRLDKAGKPTGDKQQFHKDGSVDSRTFKKDEVSDRCGHPQLPDFLQPGKQSPEIVKKAKELESLAKQYLSGNPDPGNFTSEVSKLADLDIRQLSALNEQFALDKSGMKIGIGDPPQRKITVYVTEPDDPKDPTKPKIARIFRSDGQLGRILSDR